jgi:chemotaxis protein methyltransferase CheR
MLLKGWTFEVTATDLNDRSIETAKAGVYGEYALRNTSEFYKRKYFTPGESGKLQVSKEVKARVTFSRLNLSDDSKMLFMKGVDLIFCCNVLIYFDVASKRRVVQHFYSSLQAPGYFFLGHAESLYQVSDQFRLVHLPGATTYLKAAPGSEGTARP